MNKIHLPKYVEAVEFAVDNAVVNMHVIIEDGLYNVKSREDFINVISDLIDVVIKLQIKLEELRQNFKRGVSL
jgi:pantothenate kinase